MIAVLRTFAHCVSLSIALALPSNLRRLPLGIREVDSKTLGTSSTTSNPLPADTVSCLRSYITPRLVLSDCSIVINSMLLSQPGPFEPRIFRQNTYRTELGWYARSRWQHGNCELSVHGPRNADQLLTFLDVAVAADKIVLKCVINVTFPKGGLMLVGDMSKGFHVVLQGHEESESDSAKNSSASQESAISVSRRAMQSRHHSEKSVGSQAVEIRDPLMGVSRVANHPAVTPNSTIGTAPPARHPVQCFNPFIVHLQPAAATDCGFVINQIILRLFDPTRQLTFGFTDAADVNLLKLEYHAWQYGQCVISVKNHNVAQVDTFRLLDLATTARRITIQCLVNTQDKLGGVANIGTDGRGFYVYIGGPLISSFSLSDVMLLSESNGAESF
ncbi:MAG: hypothetical protein ASARMPRED_002466 [Alectoria sarmentosa]|nr:MAG: hypothetical protein ASARMPRED_002466 [Alectoria sarmentosa]